MSEITVTAQFGPPVLDPDIHHGPPPAYGSWRPYDSRVWYARDNAPGLIDVTWTHESGPDQGRAAWREATAIEKMRNNGMGPTYDAVGLHVLRDEPEQSGMPHRIRVTIPAIPEFCDRANAILSARTPEGEKPFRFIPYYPPDGGSPEFSSETMVDAIANNIMLFSIHQEFGDPTHPYLLYSYHDVITHSAWLALSPATLKTLQERAQALQAMPPGKDRINAMKAFVGMLDGRIANDGIVGDLVAGELRESGLKECLGEVVAQQQKSFWRALKISGSPIPTIAPNIENRGQISSDTISEVQDGLYNALMGLGEVAICIRSGNTALKKSLETLTTALNGSTNTYVQQIYTHLLQAIAHGTSFETAIAYADRQLTIYTEMQSKANWPT